jgi:hypothetical protein
MRTKKTHTLKGVRAVMRTGRGQQAKIALEGTIAEENRDIIGWLTLEEARWLAHSLSYHIEKATAEETTRA